MAENVSSGSADLVRARSFFVPSETGSGCVSQRYEGSEGGQAAVKPNPRAHKNRAKNRTIRGAAEAHVCEPWRAHHAVPMIVLQTDRTHGLAVCRAAGHPLPAEVIAALEHVATLVSGNESHDALIVIEDTGAFLAFSDMRILRPLAKRWRAKRRSTRWALVVGDRSKQAMAKMVVQLLRLRTADFECFTSEDSARNWLLSGRS